MLKGAAASPGVGIGRAVRVLSQEPVVLKKKVQDREAEKFRLKDAIKVFVAEITQASMVVSETIGSSEAGILNAQIAIANDPELTKEIHLIIDTEQVNLEYAFSKVCDRYIALFSDLEDELISSRSADFRDIKHRFLSILMGLKKPDLSLVPEGSILVAEDISPSQAAQLDVKRIRGIVTQGGTRFSHISIMSRALGLPAVVAVDHLLASVQEGDTIIVDGDNGGVFRNPSEPEYRQYKAKRKMADRLRKELDHYRTKPAVTLDDRRIQLDSNLAMAQELESIRHCNADGIGLFRTEFLYMDRTTPPSEEEQFEVYRKIAQYMEGRPVVIRTLDVGGDKDLPYLGLYKEDNPYMGFRAIRFCLQRPEVFRTQLTALLRAGVHGNIRIMVPMITSLAEIKQVRKMIEEIKGDLRIKGIPFREDISLGTMVETPSAALCARSLAREVDFFSIGTNDLTQYTLAVDRGNEHVSRLYTTLHPAMLRLIYYTILAGKDEGIQVGVCGEAASDPLLIPFLVGAGVDELSVGCSSLLAVRRQINNLSYLAWKEYLDTLLLMETAEEISRFMTRVIQ